MGGGLTMGRDCHYATTRAYCVWLEGVATAPAATAVAVAVVVTLVATAIVIVIVSFRRCHLQYSLLLAR